MLLPANEIHGRMVGGFTYPLQGFPIQDYRIFGLLAQRSSSSSVCHPHQFPGSPERLPRGQHELFLSTFASSCTQEKPMKPRGWFLAQGPQGRHLLIRNAAFAPTVSGMKLLQRRRQNEDRSCYSKVA